MVKFLKSPLIPVLLVLGTVGLAVIAAASQPFLMVLMGLPLYGLLRYAYCYRLKAQPAFARF